MRISADAALVDIEGTLGSIAFVQDVLFPYARARIEPFVHAHCEEVEVRAILDAAARDAAVDVHDLRSIVAALHEWSDRDVKITPLKELQGLIWKSGFESGAIRAELYPDAIEALRRFHGAGAKLFVYSSGSIAAQQLLFGHTVAGDLRSIFSGYFDTATGSKRDAGSYERIAEKIALPPSRVVFFSDDAGELDAARASGMQTVQLARPQDGVSACEQHPAVDAFTGIEITTGKC